MAVAAIESYVHFGVSSRIQTAHTVCTANEMMPTVKKALIWFFSPRTALYARVSEPDGPQRAAPAPSCRCTSCR